MKSFQHFFYEKTVLGLIEDIQIDGIGTITAKLDSGNGAYNVLHGENIESDGKIARFTTINGIRMESVVKDTIVINVGAGNKEERPVVMLNVRVGGKEFPQVPFSIGNRSDNMHKVLIGKNFIQKELDALIDVSVNNIANKNIEVSL